MLDNLLAIWRALQRRLEAGLGPPTELDPAARIEAFIAGGGPTAALLLILAALAGSIILLKALQFGLLRVGARRRVRGALKLWHRGSHRKALQRLLRLRSPTARALAAAMQGMLGDSPRRDKVEREARRVLQNETAALHGYLTVLLWIAAAGPLLGLSAVALRAAAVLAAPSAARIEALLAPLGFGCVLAAAALAGYLWLQRRVTRHRQFGEDQLALLLDRTPQRPVGSVTSTTPVTPAAPTGRQRRSRRV